MNGLTPRQAVDGERRARQKRQAWESHWAECYAFALPQRGGGFSGATPGGKRTDKLYDATASDAVDQLAASLLARLTPPWARWFGLIAGPDATPEERDLLAPVIERAGEVLKSHFDRSNFAVEVHQCYLDLVTAGTACLLMEEAEPGAASALTFTAVPLSQVALDEGPSGRLDVTYRKSALTAERIAARFPGAALPPALSETSRNQPDAAHPVIEAVAPENGTYAYMAVLEADGTASEPVVLKQGRFAASPFINFRWLKAPGEVYGRSPVMKVLPDIKTANKVVELTLKNASIAVTGIWQADDDGVLNPAAIKLVPGTIIPKAVGSSGLTPLSTPTRFDVSGLVLDDLRQTIRRALLADKLGMVDAPKMTATEVLERAAEMARLLGATYGRLQSELLTPLVLRGLNILIRRGEIEGLEVDGKLVDLQYSSPLARQQTQQEAAAALQWIEGLALLGPEAEAVLDKTAAARWLARSHGVPEELLRPAGEDPTAGLDQLLETGVEALAQAVTDEQGGQP